MEELQSLLEKINREGVEKADAEAKKIIDAAQAKAADIVAAARRDQARATADAEKAAADYQRRADETIRQQARDIVIGVRDSVTRLLESVLMRNVDSQLQDERVVADLVSAAVKDLTGPGEITCGEKLAKALAAQLASKGEFTVITDESAESGFTVRLDGGRVEHAFTCEVIAAELAKRLRGDLAKLVVEGER